MNTRNLSQPTLTGTLFLAAALTLVAAPAARAQYSYSVSINDSINGAATASGANTPGGVERSAVGDVYPRRVNVFAKSTVGHMGAFAIAEYREPLPFGSNLSAAAVAQCGFTDSLLITGAPGPVTVILGVALTGSYSVGGPGLGAGQTSAVSSINAYLTGGTSLGSAFEKETSYDGRTGNRLFSFTVSSGTTVHITGSMQVSAFAGGASTATASYQHTARYFALTDTPGASVQGAGGYDYIAAGQAITAAPEPGAGVLAAAGLLPLAGLAGLAVTRRRFGRR